MSEAFRPRVLVFSCNWCSYTAADLAGTSRLQVHPDVTVIRVMCSGRVEPVLILSALTQGFDGVMVTGCHPGDGHYLTGNVHARERMDFLEALLSHFGLADRVEMNYVSASEGLRFAEVTADFRERIDRLGPSPLRGMDLPALADRRGRFHQLLIGIRDRLDRSFEEELKLAADQVIAGFGHPVYDRDKCIGCGTCVAVCPFGVPRLSERNHKVIKCDQCDELVQAGEEPRCVTACPKGALLFVEADVPQQDRRQRVASMVKASLGL